METKTINDYLHILSLLASKNQEIRQLGYNLFVDSEYYKKNKSRIIEPYYYRDLNCLIHYTDEWDWNYTLSYIRTDIKKWIYRNLLIASECLDLQIKKSDN